MLTGIHFLLTYTCIFECDHCFLYCGPEAMGTFTAKQIRQVLDEAEKIGTVEWIYFEGGEAFLYYPLLLEGVRLAKQRGFKVGIVSNCFWANDEHDAELWLKPLHDIGIDDLSLSDDAFHQGNVDEKDNTARKAYAAAKRMGLPVSSICIEKPEITIAAGDNPEKGQPVIGGGAMLRGRAVEKLTEGLPRAPYDQFTTCPHEELEHPGRVHVDPFGHVHICQGISMGNMWKTPLSILVKEYDAGRHPICGPLIKGGPAGLAETHQVKHDTTYIDACHFCSLLRKEMMGLFPDYLAPKQVYGL